MQKYLESGKVHIQEITGAQRDADRKGAKLHKMTLAFDKERAAHAGTASRLRAALDEIAGLRDQVEALVSLSPFRLHAPPLTLC